MKRLILSAALLSLIAAAPAAAYTISMAGDSFSTTFDGNVGGTVQPGLTADADFLVQSFTQDLVAGTTTIVIDVTLYNTTDASIWQSSRLSAIGFDTTPTIDRASATGLFDYANVAGAFPNGFGSIDVCAIDNSSNCNGGSSGGLDIGEFGVVTMTLAYDSLVSSVDLTNLGIRWQSLDSKQLGISGDSGTGREATAPIPEPGAALAFGIGMLLIGARQKRR